MIVTWIIAALFAMLTIVFLAGKGSFLIAGYNTASEEEKATYDEKKLCRVMGLGTGMITVTLVAFSMFYERAPEVLIWVFIIGIVLASALMIVCSNTMCRAPRSSSQEGSSHKEPLKNRSIMIGACIFITVVFCAVGILLETGNVTVHTEGDSLEIIGSYWPDKSVSYDTIHSVILTENFNVGTRTNGLGSSKLEEGHFRNDSLGNYILYSYTKCKSYIVIATSTEYVVINAENRDKTETLYKEILLKME